MRLINVNSGEIVLRALSSPAPSIPSKAAQSAGIEFGAMNVKMPVLLKREQPWHLTGTDAWEHHRPGVLMALIATRAQGQLRMIPVSGVWIEDDDATEPSRVAMAG